MKTEQSLHNRQNPLADAREQIRILEKTDCSIPSFGTKLAECNCSPLLAETPEILQVNTGYRCNLVCRHCHVDGGPDRTESMSRETMRHCLDALHEGSFGTLDITGGAPEMNPDLPWFIREARKTVPEGEILVRTNLVILLSGKQYGMFPELYRETGVTIIASLPCYTRDNVDAQRGEGIFDRSIEALKLLNSIGYGTEGSGLKLNLVYNPGGPALPGQQQALEADYRKQLSEQYGIAFNGLYTITNMPVSRFLSSLVEEGRFCEYMKLLADHFNPCATKNLMCRTTLSVGWDGTLYDCDFNQMLQLPLSAPAPRHIRDFDKNLLGSRRITTGQHCFGCTAGAGSSCQGSLL
ncbi:MAG: radical SAM/Cys-rich domain protein [Chlorobiaceae bacterium]|nr:radical SAM/Cys-rich domain protein [Chlorobiaceae bacterium]NTV60818.1 radical SAM/Cys-rich domain protein [Chlorobiaceae bacterium]